MPSMLGKLGNGITSMMVPTHVAAFSAYPPLLWLQACAREA